MPRSYADKMRKKFENKSRGEKQIKPIKKTKRVTDRQIREHFLTDELAEYADFFEGVK
jgi:hypothetical protein